MSWHYSRLPGWSMREWPVVIVAYALTWTVFGTYAYYLMQRARRARNAAAGLEPASDK